MLLRAIVLCVAVSCCASVCLGQASPDEAAAKLRAKQAERAAQRSKLVQITAGELDDLREQVRLLRAQVDALQRKQAEANGTAVKPVVKRVPTQIEIGMTRAEVDAFIRAHRNLKVIGVSANAGVTKQAEETVVRRQGATGAQRAVNGKQTDVQEATGGEQKETVERKSTTGRKETITVAQMVARQVVTGETRDVFGRPQDTYGTEWVEGARMKVDLTDGVVTAIDGSQG
jgi:hypothetical protein